MAQLPSGRELKFKFSLKPKKSEAYTKLDNVKDELVKDTKQKILNSYPTSAVVSSNCHKDPARGLKSERVSTKHCIFDNLPENVCDDIKTDFEDIEDNVCKELPKDTFDDIKDDFDDIEVAID